MIVNRTLLITSIILCFSGCVEPFEFDVEDSQPPLVIESFISDVSYNESRLYPSDGRYFTTQLLYGQNLNGGNSKATGAEVRLISENGESWLYSEVHNSPGKYILYYPDFKASPDVNYKLRVVMPDDNIYESEWESFSSENQQMGEVWLEEDSRLATFFNNKGTQSIRAVKGVNINIDIPMKSNDSPVFYKWKFESTWIYLAGRKSNLDANYKCWVHGNSYLSQYAIAEVSSGGYPEELVFIDVDDNERVFEEISVLVKQFTISKEYYNFLNELQQQSQTSGIFDAPPYNLKTNYHHINGDKPVFGYFSVAHEEATRIYFSVDNLSYNIENSYIAQCLSAIPYFAPDDPCDNCLNYEFGGVSSLIEPTWWHR